MPHGHLRARKLPQPARTEQKSPFQRPTATASRCELQVDPRCFLARLAFDPPFLT